MVSQGNIIVGIIVIAVISTAIWITQYTEFGKKHRLASQFGVKPHHIITPVETIRRCPNVLLLDPLTRAVSNMGEQLLLDVSLKNKAYQRMMNNSVGCVAQEACRLEDESNMSCHRMGKTVCSHN